MTRQLARAVWVILAAVALLGAGAALGSLPDAIARYRAEPEDVYGLVALAALGLFLSGLWASLAWNTRRGRASGTAQSGTGPAALLIVLGILIIAVGLADSSDGPMMFGIGGVAMASGALFLWLVRDRFHVACPPGSDP